MKATHFCACALTAGFLAAPALGSVFAFNWSRPSDTTVEASRTGPFTYQVGSIAVDESAGRINAISASFDSLTNRMSWSLNIGDLPSNTASQSLSGFTLLLTGGGQPNGPGEVAQFYFDATGPSPILTAYAYNGHPWSPSHEDGSWLPGVQQPDRIFTSLNDSASVVQSLSDIVEADGSRRWSFDIDIASIVAHQPLYPQPWPWIGAGFGDEVGIFVQTFTDTHVSYSDDGYVSGVCVGGMGSFEASHQPTVPAPGVASLLALAMVRGNRRRRS